MRRKKWIWQTTLVALTVVKTLPLCLPCAILTRPTPKKSDRKEVGCLSTLIPKSSCVEQLWSIYPSLVAVAYRTYYRTNNLPTQIAIEAEIPTDQSHSPVSPPS